MAPGEFIEVAATPTHLLQLLRKLVCPRTRHRQLLRSFCGSIRRLLRGSVQLLAPPLRLGGSLVGSFRSFSPTGGFSRVLALRVVGFGQSLADVSVGS